MSTTTARRCAGPSEPEIAQLVAVMFDAPSLPFDAPHRSRESPGGWQPGARVAPRCLPAERQQGCRGRVRDGCRTTPTVETHPRVGWLGRLGHHRHQTLAWSGSDTRRLSTFATVAGPP